MTKSKCIGITGGSGHLGTGLILKCLEEGFEVKALFLNTPPVIEHPRLTWVDGDINDLKQLKKNFKKVDLIVHCAAIISVGEYSKTLVHRVNIDGTKAIITLCKFIKAQLIYISSSTAISEPSNGQPFNEEGPYRRSEDFFYGYTKGISEKAVLKAVKEDGLEAFILRPSSIVGTPDYRPSLFGKALIEMSQGKLPVLSTGGHHVVDLRDLCQTIVNSFELGKTGQIYLLGGPYISISRLAKLCRPKGIFITLPAELLILFAPLIEGLSRTFGLNTALSKTSLKLLKQASEQIDCSKAQKELGHTNRPIEETVTDFLNWSRGQNP
jgi:dihydroflavonol-4-reductase